jgi:hypothetical protein
VFLTADGGAVPGIKSFCFFFFRKRRIFFFEKKQQKTFVPGVGSTMGDLAGGLAQAQKFVGLGA